MAERADDVENPQSPERISPSRLCLGCDSPLPAAMIGRCPRCGRPFDVSNASTVNSSGHPLGFARRAVLRGPGVVLMAITSASFVASIWYARAPGVDIEQQVFLLCAWVISIVLWACRVGIGMAVLSRIRIATARAVFLLLRRYMWLPALLIILHSALFFDVPMQLAFAWSRSQMEGLALSLVSSGRGVDTRVQWVGLYHIESVHVNDGAVVFRIAGRRFKGRTYGFIYVMDGRRTNGLRRFREVGRGWYLYEGTRELGGNARTHVDS